MWVSPGQLWLVRSLGVRAIVSGSGFFARSHPARIVALLGFDGAQVERVIGCTLALSIASAEHVCPTLYEVSTPPGNDEPRPEAGYRHAVPWEGQAPSRCPF